jgi:hypothetical protein
VVMEAVVGIPLVIVTVCTCNGSSKNFGERPLLSSPLSISAVGLPGVPVFPGRQLLSAGSLTGILSMPIAVLQAKISWKGNTTVCDSRTQTSRWQKYCAVIIREYTPGYPK